MTEKKHAKGLFAKQPPKNAPFFAIGTLHVNWNEFKIWAENNLNEQGFLNIQMTKGKNNTISTHLMEWVK